jgi:REP element-mobilizing transposase RayT
MAFWRLYYHLVWATKNREHLIQPEIEKRVVSLYSLDEVG